MILKFVESVGERTINSLISFYEAAIFWSSSFLGILNPINYNSNIRKDLITKIYHSSIVIIPHSIAAASIFGSILIGVLILIATEYNMQIKIGSLIVTFVLNEFSPLISTLFVVFNSQKDINRQEIENLVIPNLLSGMISVITLSILFTLIMIMSGYLFTFFFMGMDLYTYKSLIFNAIEIQNIFILLLKSLILGFVVSIIPIYRAIKNLKKGRNIAKILIAIFFIEIFSLLLQKAYNAI